MTMKNKKKKPIRLILTGLLCFLLLFTIVPRAKSVVELSAQKKVLQQEKARLEKINIERTQVSASLDTPEAIERIAREKLGMVKNGERTMVKVVK